MVLENGYLLRERYRILDILGQGGMGAVYRALDENLDIIVAIKENTFTSEDHTRQFQREAKVLAGLRHPNLPRVFDYFVIEKQGQYLVMDYIEGEDLRQWLSREEILSEADALYIGIAICDALIYLHNQDPVITHRDIKPGNIKITPGGEIVLVDFGLVKVSTEREKTTSAARAMTPGYSPPEQYGESPTDHRSDLFSLGATLYAALAGYLPEDSLARATGNATLTPLRQYVPHVSRRTADAIEKALALRFEERWQSASAFQQILIEARDAIPREGWSAGVLTNQSPVENGMDEKAHIEKSKPGKLSELMKPFQPGESKNDPVWLIYGLIIVIILLLLGSSLIWPEKITGIFWGTVTNTEMLNISATPNRSFNNTLQETATPEETPTPAMPTTTPENVVLEPTTPSPTPQGGGTGLIAYVSERTGQPQIWLLDVMSGDTAQLTNLEEGACQPDWAPDGSEIVFTSPCARDRSLYPGSSLFILDIEEGHLRQITASLEGDFEPAWSPDGQWIAYTSLVNGKRQLMKINLEYLDPIRLSEGLYEEFHPAWSPDGALLAFVRLRSVNQIYLMDSNGENAVQFSLSGLIDNSHPAWYPDGSIILFSQVLGLGSPSKQLFGMRLEDIGQEEEYAILPSSNLDYIPLMDRVDVSPDGFWLAFDYWYFDVFPDIYIMVFPGGNLVQLTEHPERDYDPDWCPAP